MNKIVVAVLLAQMYAYLSAAQLRIDCSGGRFFVDYIVSDGDSCSGERSIIIDGEEFIEALPEINNSNRTILLGLTSKAEIAAEMTCVTSSGFTDFNLAVARTQSGCVGETTPPAPPSPPQPPGFPDGVPVDLPEGNAVNENIEEESITEEEPAEVEE